jgi:hypothetical protein
MIHTKPLRPRDVARLSSSVAGRKFIMRRHQDGLEGDVTATVREWPVEKVKRWVMHGILFVEPASNYLMWGKDVGMWCTKNKLEHPATISQLQYVQEAMEIGDVKAVQKPAPKSVQAEVSQATIEEIQKPKEPSPWSFSKKGKKS